MSEENEKAINELLKECGSKTTLCKGLGSTELMAAASQSFPECNPIGSVGIPLVKVNCCVEDPETGTELQYGKEGELCFSGPTLMIGYYGKQEETDDIIKIHSDGERWLHTGDLGYVNEDGVIFVTGRIKRIIMTRDENSQVTKMFPDRIEKTIYLHQMVEACCVIGVEDKERINYPKAFIMLKDKKNENSIKKEIIDICVQNLPEYMIPEVIEIVEDLPRTPRGKIDYRALEKSN